MKHSEQKKVKGANSLYSKHRMDRRLLGHFGALLNSIQAQTKSHQEHSGAKYEYLEHSKTREMTEHSGTESMTKSILGPRAL